MSKWVKVAAVGEVPEGAGKVVEAEGRALGLFNVAGSFHVIDNACSHAGGSLGEGSLKGEEVECPWHGARFSVKSGKALSAPAAGEVPVCRVRVIGSDIEVEI